MTAKGHQSANSITEDNIQMATDIFENLKRAVMECDPEGAASLAIDLIEEVGPIPGLYLDKEHTRKWWKREQFLPKAADRLIYPEWMRTGKKGCLDYAEERMEEILATHKPKPLTPSQEEEIERILKEGRDYYKKRGLISDEEWAAYRKV